MIDITRPLSVETAPWPGDDPLQIDWTLKIARGDNVSLSRLTFSPHVGTHADAPSHYEPPGTSTGSFDLAAFIGPVRVIDLRGCESVSVERLKERDAIGARRLLVRLLGELRPQEFVSDFAPLEMGAADALVHAGLMLYGTDAPSIDPVTSSAMSAHRVLGAGGVPILENLDLTHAEPGEYDLVALPVKLIDAEAAPVRAVLLPPGSVAAGR